MKIRISLSARELILDRKDLNWAKRDPHAFAESFTLADLVALVRTTQDAYHNKGKSQLTDAQYEVVKDELAKRRPNHTLLKKVGATPSTGRKKVRLPYSLFSLDKIKPGEDSFSKWVSGHKGPYVVSDKEDGLSIEVIYEDGIPKRAYTRGNGLIGQDVSHLIPDLEIPLSIPYRKLFVVRMEAAMKDADFSKHYAKDKEGKGYENARNLVAGVINTLNKRHAALAHIHTICYEIIEPRMKPSLALDKLKEYHFNVVPYKLMASLDEQVLTKLLISRKKSSPVSLDGLVIEQDKKTERPKLGNPDYQVAFKIEVEGDVVEAVVTGVLWQESQFGTLKPVIQIKPVRLAGVTVKQATGFNAKFIETGSRQKEKKTNLKVTPIGVGAVVKIKRSGDVIPHVISVIKGARKPSMPTVPYEYTDTGVNIKLVENNDLVRAKRITTFFTTLGIDFIKLGTVEKMADIGLTSIVKILRASKEDFLEMENTKALMAGKIYKAIHDKTSQPIPLATLMKASGQFGEGMGERRINEILKAYPDILDRYNEGPAKVLALIKGIPGFQDKTAQVFVKGIPGFAKWLKLSKLKPMSVTESIVKPTGSALKGQFVGFTGFRSKELEAKIVQQGGTITQGVTKQTTILLVANTSTTSSKAEKARAKGVKILSADEFTKKYKL